MKAFLLSLLLFGNAAEGSVNDTITVPSVVVSYKGAAAGKGTSPVTFLPLRALEDRGVTDGRALSSLVPNLHIPDYGTAMTSSIYLRGFGSRMDNPVLGLYIDDIPVLDKNAYDFEWLDISRAELQRGPQGTLYGRNALSGVLSLTTLSPALWQGFRGAAEYGSFGTLRLRASLYEGNFGGGVSYTHRGGYYRNSFDDSPADRLDAVQLRFRWGKMLSGGASLENIFTGNATLQKGYPYRRLSGGELLPVCYNDPAGYRRISALDGVKFSKSNDRFVLRSVSSVQLLLDRMDMDQDFTEKGIFTLRQVQRQGALTQEVILRPTVRPDWWDCVSGAFGMLRLNGMSAPVTFYQEGIDELILQNANANIPSWIGGSLAFTESSFPIESEFLIFTGAAALYHESWFTFGRWQLTAGLRVGLEGGVMRYDSEALIHYTFSPYVTEPKAFPTVFKGSVGQVYPEILPKFSVRYGDPDAFIALTASKGSRAGGFNTQLFSDILQNEMKLGLMHDLHVSLVDEDASDVRKTTYKDEACWNFELTGRWARPFGEHRFRAEATLFWMEGFRQQLTVFPPGKNTGRMMTNAGRSRSRGAEVSLEYAWKGLELSASYGFTDARFVRFHDGNADYAGKRIPYSPRHTVSALGAYYIDFHRKDWKGLRLEVNFRGVGDIAWNESNTLKEPFVPLLGAGVSLVTRRLELYFRGDNLLGKEYGQFYFRSMGNDFYQMSRPLALRGGIKITI